MKLRYGSVPPTIFTCDGVIFIVPAIGISGQFFYLKAVVYIQRTSFSVSAVFILECGICYSCTIWDSNHPGVILKTSMSLGSQRTWTLFVDRNVLRANEPQMHVASECVFKNSSKGRIAFAKSASMRGAPRSMIPSGIVLSFDSDAIVYKRSVVLHHKLISKI